MRELHVEPEDPGHEQEIGDVRVSDDIDHPVLEVHLMSNYFDIL